MRIVKNFIFNLSYQILIIILPLITVPYISRVLGPENVGIFGYTNSLVSYFTLLASLSCSIYGSRQVAYVRDDKEKLNKTFWEIVILKVFISTVVIILYYLFIKLFVPMQYKLYSTIQIVCIITVLIDISWFFIGMEDLKKTVSRNLVVKLISLSLIFTFVKDGHDLWKYISIIVISDFIGQAILWIYIKKYIRYKRIKVQEPFKHLLPMINLFIPQIAIQVYVILDKTMIGYLTNVTEVGYYDMAQKIVKLPLGIVTSLGLVLLPRISNLYANGEEEKIRYYITKSLNFVLFLALPIYLGIISISNNLVFWFLGESFLKSGNIMKITSIIIVFIGMSNVIGIQLMLPLGKEREFTISVTTGAIINFILNSIFILKFASIGASISTVIAEFSVTFVQFIFMRRYFDLKLINRELIKYILSSGIMFFSILFISKIIILKGALLTLIQIIVGVIIYFVMLFILKSEILRFILEKVLNVLNSKLNWRVKNV